MREGAVKMSEMKEYLNGLQHIGIPCRDIEETIGFYEKLGMEVAYRTENDGLKVCFLQQGTMVIETYEEPIVNVTGAINHICFDVTDIEKAFECAKEMQVTFCDEEIQFLPFWDNGVRYFTILGPNGERVEFCQKL